MYTKWSWEEDQQIEAAWGINLNKFQIGDEGQHIKNSRRIIVEDYKNYPFNCIGKIVSTFRVKTKKGLQQVSLFGTGTLIGPNLILTVAHNFYHRQYRSKAIKSQFIPFSQQKQNILKSIQIQIPSFHHNYQNSQNKYQQRYDMIIASLRQNTLIKKNQFLKIDWNYSFLENMNREILVVGYSSDHQENSIKQIKGNNVLSYCQYKPFDQKENFLYYKHTTFGGNSGGPVLYRKQKSQQYEIIAIHKGDLQNCNYGILLNSSPTSKQIFGELVQINKIQKLFAENSLLSHYLPININREPSNQSDRFKQQNKQLKLQIEQLKKKNSILEQKLKKLKKQISDNQNLINQLIQKKSNNYTPVKKFQLDTPVKKFQLQTPQQMKMLINPVFQSSKIIKNNDQVQFILNLISPKQNQSLFGKNFLNIFTKQKVKPIKLLYQASQNQFLVSKFHEKCDGVTNTLTLCQTQFGNIIGGYNPFSWKQQKNIYRPNYPECFYKFDTLRQYSFIFSLTKKQKFSINPIQNRQYEVLCRTDFGPTFGYGHDLVIQDRANQNTNSFARIGYTYVHENYIRDSKQAWYRFSGAKQDCKFRVKEWQVWEI